MPPPPPPTKPSVPMQHQSASTRDKKLRASLQKTTQRHRDAIAAARSAEILRPETGPGYVEAEGELERTYKLDQRSVKHAVDVATAQKGFELELVRFGGYAVDYTRDGAQMLVGGRKGHVAWFDWREGRLGCEVVLAGEVVRDVKWLHNTHFFAAAQKKYVYIYDQQGVEIHCLKKHIEVTHMEYLPYHHLLATIGNAGWLKYQDTSTGSLITEIRTKLGTPTSTTLNPRNAVVHVGHSNGTVTLWGPNLQTPLAKLLSNRGPIRALAADRGGHYLATAGADSRLNIFDIRTFKQLHTYLTPTPPTSLSISDTGLLAAGWGSGHVTLWKDALRTRQPTPYMSHHQPGSAITSLRFCPYEDILAAGHATGVSSLIVPGAGEPNFDALEANPYAGKKQRQEAEVRGLLEKLRPEMIRLDPDFVGKVADPQPQGRGWGEASEEGEAKDRRLSLAPEKDEKFKMRGKNSALQRLLRKKGRGNVRDERREKLERLKREHEERQKGDGAPEKLGPALDRFKRKGRP